MKDTASPSLASQVGFAAKVIRCLEKAGMTQEDFVLLTNDVRRRNDFVSQWRNSGTPEPEWLGIPERPDPRGLSLFLKALLRRGNFSWGAYPPAMQEGIIEKMMQMFQEEAVLARLLEDYTQKHLRNTTIVVLRAGLRDGECWTQKDIGQYVGLSDTRVRELELKAMGSLSPFIHRPKGRLDPFAPPPVSIFEQVKEDYLDQLVAAGDKLIGGLFTPPVEYFVKDTVSFTLGQLSRFSERELREWRIVNISTDDAIAEIKSVLGANGLGLRQES